MPNFCPPISHLLIHARPHPKFVYSILKSRFLLLLFFFSLLKPGLHIPLYFHPNVDCNTFPRRPRSILPPFIIPPLWPLGAWAGGFAFWRTDISCIVAWYRAGRRARRVCSVDEGWRSSAVAVGAVVWMAVSSSFKAAWGRWERSFSM